MRYPLGLHLAVGAVVLIAASWMFGGIAEDVVKGDPLTVVDVRIADWLHAHAEPRLTRVMLAVSNMHDVAGIALLGGTFALFLIWRREWHWLLVEILALPGGMLLNIATKLAFHRARPSFEDPLLVLNSYSFPSGHVTASVLFYGLIVAFAIARVRRWRWKVLLGLGAFLIVMTVAFSRMYLGVHYLSDTLAAFAQATAWLTVCITGVDALRRRAAM